MTPQVITTIVLAIFAAFWGLAKLLTSQTLKQLDERFTTQDTARKAVQTHWESEFTKLEVLARSNEKDLLLMRGDLPNLYLRREDYIRGQSTIEAKLDAIASELKMVQIKGGKS